jgi:hypothetical protein
MLTKRLHAVCKRTALVTTMAFVVAATSLTTLANPNINSPSSGGEENVSFNSGSPTSNLSCENEKIDLEDKSNMT